MDNKSIYYNKYKKYKNKYILGKINQIGGYDHTNSNDMIKYLNCLINGEQCEDTKIEKKKSFDKPYLLILYGPPASGKTKARDLMINHLNLSNNHIQIDVDKFVYDTDQWKEFISKINKEKITGLQISEIDQNDKVKLIQSEYKNIRSKTSNMIHILMGIALMYNYNVTIEMSGRGLDWYMTHIIDEFIHSKYDIYLVYPYTNNLDILYQRAMKRAEKEYRYVNKNFIDEASKAAKENFNKIIDQKDKFNGIIVYDIEKININDKEFEDSILLEYKGENLMKGDINFFK